MANTTTGLLAAFFLAVSILHVRESHFAMTDALMTSLLTASLTLLLRAIDMDPAAESAESRSERDPMVCGGRVRWRTRHIDQIQRRGGPRRAWGRAVVLGSSVAERRSGGQGHGCPPQPLERLSSSVSLWRRPMRSWTSRHSRRTSSFDVMHLSIGHGVNLGRGWQYHLTNSLPYGLGVPLFVAALVGIWPLARDFPRQAIVLGAFAAAFYGLIGSGQTVFFRYVLPLVPILCLSAAVAAERAARWIAARTAVTPLTAAVGPRATNRRDGTREQRFVRRDSVEDGFPRTGRTLAGPASST